jgi:multidrug efflux system membrane fusion protein
MMTARRSPFLGPCLILASALTGCSRAAPQPAPPEPPAIPVSRPVVREVTEYVDFTGRTEAVQSVDVRPRTTGYLEEMPFKEGSEVKKGDLLFVIDPRPYQAQYDQAVGLVDLYKAQLKLARTTYARDRAINNMTPGAISRQQLDQDAAAVEEAEARVNAYQKNLEVYRLNQEFTRVVSPIHGMVSRYYLTLGNLVNQDQTLLTTVVSLDPIYGYFDVDEPTVIRVRKGINEGRVPSRASGARLTVLMGLQGEDGFPHEGEVDFVNNQLNPTTGSILLRGVFPNPRPAKGVRLLSPGMFVRIRLPIGRPHPATLVVDRAVLSDQGLKYVYVVDASDTVQYRRVTTGPLQDDGLRLISEGLRPEEWVVVAGLQQVHSHDRIVPEQIPMPALSQPGEDGTAPAGADARTGQSQPKKQNTR